jgi:hypothetical protein
MFHDVLEMKLNRVHVNVEERGRQTMKTFDIDVKDEFWEKTSSLTLPEVGGNMVLISVFIEEETKNYEKAVNEVGGNPDDIAASNIGTESLTAAIERLPELQMRKKVLDMHTSIASTLLRAIVDRNLDAFISMEESISNQVDLHLIEWYCFDGSN